ncbi:unnamed protein product [Macrosiphum euphorbiae]|uniref:Secreted protein n=1 Tax=Macrosiphum euphorbiae TaxID=13131 RepID=A0AAV0Y3V2_9HEMI|nr:unnamed protein product [Macrosiphum euphorbiae]CAI6375036.1 unnamed protein product [Macrosiphum euphorbiae]CAI6375042.1 unnamed protein product [Macrosiphum euphorbiae]CAI6375043.1 unnamed protein product [Macrosiphum euphorbiae]CAI6375044.1 unnamed protein product [Macrosiphum euphorbiae]
MSRSISGLCLATFLTIRSGTPSGPGAFPRGILLLSSTISVLVTAGKSWVSMRGGQAMVASLGNRASTIDSTLPGVESPGMGLLPTSFLVTNLYGRPHGSTSTCFSRSFQLFRLLTLMATFSSFLARPNSSRL